MWLSLSIQEHNLKITTYLKSLKLIKIQNEISFDLKVRITREQEGLDLAVVNISVVTQNKHAEHFAEMRQNEHEFG